MTRKKVVTDDQVRAIRNEHMAYIIGRGYKALAKKYNCAESTIRDIVKCHSRVNVR